MEIKFSRHARRRMKLYKIPKDIVFDLVKHEKNLGKQTIVKPVKGFTYPLKIVFDVTDSFVIIVTAYPLKRGLS